MDGRAALRWAKGHQPKLPLVVFGQSLGGNVALRSVLDIKNELKPDYMIVDSSFTSYRSAATKIMSKSWLLWIFQPIGWAIVDNSQGVNQDIHTLEIPLLVIHGDKDQIVDFSLGQDLFNHVSEPKEFWRIPNGRHTDFMWQANGLYSDRFFSILDMRFDPQYKKSPEKIKDSSKK